MKKLVLLVPLLAAACGGPGLPQETINRERREIMIHAAGGNVQPAYRQYRSLLERTRNDIYPGALLEIATQMLLNALNDPQPEVRCSALEALQYAEDDFAFAAAVRKLDDDSLAVQTAAADLLREVGRPTGAELMLPLLEPIQDEGEILFLTPRLLARNCLQMHALYAIASVGYANLPVPLAVTGMSSPEPAIRAISARALGAIGNPEGLPSLRYGLYHDPSWAVQTASAEAFLSLGRRPMIDAFAQEAFKSEEQSKVIWAIEMRQDYNIGPTEEQILKQATYMKPPAIRSKAAIVLGEMGYTDAKERLEQMKSHLENLVHVSAVYAVALLEKKEKIDDIEEKATNPDPQVRALTLHLLARINAERYFDVFRDRLLHDPNPEVRMAALMAFRLGPPEKAYPNLALALGDSDNSVKLTAAALIKDQYLEVISTETK